MAHFANATDRGYIGDMIVLHSTHRRKARALAMLRDKHAGLPTRKRDSLPL